MDQLYENYLLSIEQAFKKYKSIVLSNKRIFFFLSDTSQKMKFSI